MRQAITAPGAPPPAGTYSHAVRIGDLLFVSGQVPRDADGRYEPSDAGIETRRTLGNLATIVAAAGGRLADAVKITVYLADLADLPAFNAAYTDVLTPLLAGAAPPARTVVAAGLREVKVEIDAVVALPAAAAC